MERQKNLPYFHLLITNDLFLTSRKNLGDSTSRVVRKTYLNTLKHLYRAYNCKPSIIEDMICRI